MTVPEQPWGQLPWGQPYPPPQYGPPQYAPQQFGPQHHQPPPSSEGNRWGWAALACCALAMALPSLFFSVAGSAAGARAWLGSFAAAVALSLVAVVLSGIGLRRAGQRRATNRWASVVAMVIGWMNIVGTIGFVLVGWFLLSIWQAAGS